MKLVDLKPQFMGAGGEGVSHRTDRLCVRCNGENAGQCEACHGSGFEHEPVPERHGVGLSFLCPCPACIELRTGDPDRDFHLRVYVGFRNPLDGGPAYDPRPNAQWDREGETFETLTLRPSIHDKGRCGWHGFVTNGEVTSC